MIREEKRAGGSPDAERTPDAPALRRADRDAARSGDAPAPRRVALVTGASRGIGRAVALELARGGADVGVNFARDEEGAQETVRLCRELGARAEAFGADVSDEAQVERLFAAAEEALGAVSILVANAGVTRDGLVLRMDAADFDQVVATNLRGAFLCARRAARSMVRARWGRLVFVSSVVGIYGNAGQANYAASKAGVIGLANALAQELGRKGVTSNAVAPGYIATDMTADLPDAARAALAGRILLGRLGEAQDVAHAVAFLASDAASYVTGQTLQVDGGLGISLR